MRFVERFLILLSFIAICLRLIGSKDGATLELIALPLLAAFYLIAMPFLMHDPGSARIRHTTWKIIFLRILFGIGFSYSITSLLLYTLGWLPRLDMLENTLLILGTLLIIAAIRYRTNKIPSLKYLIWRIGLLLSCIIMASLLPFAHS